MDMLYYWWKHLVVVHSSSFYGLGFSSIRLWFEYKHDVEAMLTLEE